MRSSKNPDLQHLYPPSMARIMNQKFEDLVKKERSGEKTKNRNTVQGMSQT